MNRVAIALSTKDRVELSEQSLVPLLQPHKFDLFWSDGSSTAAGEKFAQDNATRTVVSNTNVRGGADAAIVFSLSTMLDHPAHYTHVGLVENDVLLDPDWFEPTMDLFRQGASDGLEVGAVSARCYSDRILVARDRYAVMHNLGAGMVIFSRKAAELVLQNFRTGFTTENRRVFNQLSGLDLARTSPFVRDPHITCADWQFDRILAEHGLASLALTPARCQMIGQVPSLEEQGLHLVQAGDDLSMYQHDQAFEWFRDRTAMIRDDRLRLPDSRFLRDEQGNTTIFPHQVPMLGGRFEGDWQLHWLQGFGPFAYKSGKDTFSEGATLGYCPQLQCPISGPCAILLQGGKRGGKILAQDTYSGWEMNIDVRPGPDMFSLSIPGNISYRKVQLTRLSGEIIFCGFVTREPQPVAPDVSFDHSMLPSP